MERYGPGALVPLTRIAGTGTGPGLPGDRRDAAGPVPEPGRDDRDSILLPLVWNAARDGDTEIVLDDATITRLAPADATCPALPHLELGVRLYATDLGAAARGTFRLEVFTVSRAAGTMTGRFLDVLDLADRTRMISAYRALPTTVDGARPVQVSCPPQYVSTHDVTRSPAVLRDALHLREHPPPANSPSAAPNMVSLADLALLADGHRLHLVSLSRRCVVSPQVISAVELTRRAHPLVRLLCELEVGQAAAPTPFLWGAARHLPFLPRLRYGRTVLSPARWRLTAAELPGPGDSFPRWADAVEAWRTLTAVPDAVTVGSGDRRLRLTLTDEQHLRLVRAELRRWPVLHLTEAPGAGELAWLGGHLHEIVVPLARDTPPLAAPRVRGVAVTSPEHAHLPGHGRWLYVKIYAHPGRHDVILCEHLPRLFASWPSPPDWWFLPYHDPEHHVRLRITAPDEPGRPGDAWCLDAIARIGNWTADLHRNGLTDRVQYDTYYPEVGRFGSGALLDAAEAVFVADSSYATELERVIIGPERDAAVAAGLVELAESFLGDAMTAAHWMVDHIEREPAPPLPRTVVRRAAELTRSGPGDPETIIGRVAGRRHRALAGYAAARRGAGIDVDAVLPALLHLHCVRALGLDRAAERTTHQLARTVALGHIAGIGRTQ